MMHWIDVEDEVLDRWASMGFAAIGFWKDQVYRHYMNGTYKHRIIETTNLIEKIHERGLEAHVYTFRNKDEFLPWDDAQDPYNEYDRFYKLGADAYFTDFPATLKRYLDTMHVDPVPTSAGHIEAPKLTWILLLLSVYFYL